MTEGVLTPGVTAPTAPHETLSDVGQMSQWKLMRIRFARNKLAMAGVIGLIIMYTLVALAPFLGPNDYTTQNADYIYGPPSPITFRGPDGQLGLRPYTYAIDIVLDQKNMKYTFAFDQEQKVPIRFFVHGEPYVLLGLLRTDVHFFGVEAAQRFYPMGADDLGRDMMARVLMGGQISMTVGLLGVALTIMFGSILGGASGYYGGLIDDAMQRMIEIIMAFPTVPLWAALAAALPNISGSFTALHRYFLITLIVSLVNWTGLAR